MFTLYQTVKWSVSESVLGGASVHTGNAAFEAFSAPEQYCFTPLLKVDCSVSDRVLKQSESSLNTCEGGMFNRSVNPPFLAGTEGGSCFGGSLLASLFHEKSPCF